VLTLDGSIVDWAACARIRCAEGVVRKSLAFWRRLAPSSFSCSLARAWLPRPLVVILSRLKRSTVQVCDGAHRVKAGFLEAGGGLGTQRAAQKSLSCGAQRRCGAHNVTAAHSERHERVNSLMIKSSYSYKSVNRAILGWYHVGKKNKNASPCHIS
jgi:hypothetical protein